MAGTEIPKTQGAEMPESEERESEVVEDVRSQRIALARTLFDAGWRSRKEIQKAVVQHFGTEVSTHDMRKVFPPDPNRRRRKAMPSDAEKSAAPPPDPMPRQTTDRREASGWILLVGDDAEVFGSKTALDRRIAERIGEGWGTKEMAVYEKVSYRTEIRIEIDFRGRARRGQSRALKGKDPQGKPSSAQTRPITEAASPSQSGLVHAEDLGHAVVPTRRDSPAPSAIDADLPDSIGRRHVSPHLDAVTP